MKKRMLLILILLLILFTSLPSMAENNLNIRRWIVESRILKNGDLEIVEDLTFYFNSKFNGIYRHLVTDYTDGIENLEVYEIEEGKEIPYRLVNSAENGDNGVYLVTTEKNNLTVKVYSPAK